jgi:Ca2+-binding RTX toxin-like protein
VAAFSSTNLGKITGFEVLGLTDILTAAGGPYDVSKIAGITGVNVLGGVTNAETSAVTGLGANALVTLGGAATATGVLSLALKTDTAADVVTIKAYNDYTDNNDTTADAVAMAQTFTATGIETINLVSSGKMNSFTPVTDYAADVVTNTITINDDALVTLNINGDKKASVTTAATMEDLTTINASANTAGVTIISSASTVDLAITGSATAANNLTGGAGADTITGGSKADVLVGGAGKDTIVGGAGNDTITGGAKADTLTGGTGNDIFVIAAGTDSSLVDLDVIADFSGNTYGQGTNGAATTAGALNADSAKWTGDIINLVAVAGGLTKIDSSVQSNAADALTFLQNIGDTTADTIGAALDSSTGRLYIDVGSDGTADMVIQLTGVTTITEAAFRIA